MANGKPNAGLMDVPSQLDPDDLAAELEIEIPDSSGVIMAEIDSDDIGSIEILPEDDGGVVVDFDPQDQRGVNEDFYANLADEIAEEDPDILDAIASDLLKDFE